MSEAVIQKVVLYVNVLPEKEMLGVTFRDTLDTSFKPPCKLFLDQATHTGFSLWDRNNCLVMFGALNKQNSMSLTGYKFEMVRTIQEWVAEFQIEQIVYEDIYLQHQDVYDRLIYIKHALEDLAYTEDSLKVGGVATNKWKQILARPATFDMQNPKSEARKYVERAYPLLFSGCYTQQITEDMVDALGMGIALSLKKGRTTAIESALRYNKKLPMHHLVLADTETPLVEQLLRTRKTRFKKAYTLDGLFELDADKYRDVFKGFRQFLSHRDGVAAVKVTPKHSDWGYLMLTQDLDMSEVSPQGEFWLLAVRKTRR